MYRRNLIDSYRNTNAASLAAETDPHRIIALLLTGAIERIQTAKAAFERGDHLTKAQFVRKAICIVEGLRGCLDHKSGGELAGTLESLYEYIDRCLLAAEHAPRAEKLDEAARLLGEIEAGWAGIKPAAPAPPPTTPTLRVAAYG